MAAASHNVIIGSGISGDQAAETLRRRDPNCRVTIITLSKLPFYNRYSLPKVFQGCDDWRDILVHPPAYYEENRITLRRNTRVVNVDSAKRTIALQHNEEIHYDQLIVCSGGRGYLPEGLSDYAHLMHNFATYEQAIIVRDALPAGGRVAMLGGDMIGLDLARTLIETGFGVTLIASDSPLWPHSIPDGEEGTYRVALENMGIEVVNGFAVAKIEEMENGKSALRVVSKDGDEVLADVVMPFYGLVPSVEFMLGSGVDIERGLLVDPHLRATDEHIWAAGDVCQIWSEERRAYRFYYGWNNVRAMGDLVARNITGADDSFVNGHDEELRLDDAGHIHSPFWDHE